RAVGIDPRLDAHAENGLQVVGTGAGVRADGAVVVERDALAGVARALVRSGVRQALAPEAVARVRAVAEGLVLRAAAAAQGDAPDIGAGVAVLAPQVRHLHRRHVVQQVVRAVRQAGKLRLRTHQSRMSRIARSLANCAEAYGQVTVTFVPVSRA